MSSHTSSDDQDATANARSLAKLEEELQQKIAELNAANQALGEAREHLQAVYDHHYQFTGLIDREGHVLMANRTAMRFAGVEEKDVIGKHFADTPWWTHSAEEQQKLRDAMATAREGQAAQFETTHPAPEGDLRIFEFRVGPVFDSDGEVKYMVPEGYDVTAQKKVERTLRESEARFRAAIESAADAIYLVGEDGCFVDANRRACISLDYSREELIDMPVTDVEVAITHDGFRTLWSKLSIDSAPGRSITVDGTHRRKDGSTFPVEVNVSRLDLDDQPLLLALVRDISERKVEEEALQRRAAFDATIAGVLARFARSSTSEMDRYIELSLEEIGTFLRVDSAYMGIIDPETKTWRVTQSWVAPGCPDFTADYQDTPLGVFPWLEGRLFDGKITFLASVDDCPPEAVAEREMFAREGLASQLLVPLRGADGIILGFMGYRSYDRQTEWQIEDLPRYELISEVIANILTRIDAEKQLHQSEERYRGLVNTMQDIIYSVSADGVILFIGPQVKRYGFSPDELVGLSFGDLVHPDDRESVLGDFQQTIVTGEEAIMTFRIEATDGRMVWFEEVGRPNRDAMGNVVSITGMLRDVTDRKRAEEERVLLAEAIDQAAEAILITDLDGSIRYVNPSFEKTTGYALHEAIGQTPRILKSGETEPGIYEQLWETISRGDVWHGRIINRRKDGSLYEVDTTISPVRNAAGVVVNYIGVNLDVTREVDLEAQLQQAQKLEAVGRLAGGVAHDFNNLLLVINSYAELALTSLEDSDPLRPDLDEILKAGHRASLLTRQLLAFSRKQLLQPEVLDINEVVHNLEKMLGRILGEDIDLVVQPADDLCRVKVDPGQIEQVIMNLAVNSRDAMPLGGSLTIETSNVVLGADEEEHLSLPPGEYARLSVTDTGEGMTAETRERIFEPFFTTKEEGKGTGLGMSTVYGIVKQSGGEISVQSEIDQGTTFEIYLPTVEADMDVDRSPKTLVSRSGDETILLVEDEDAARDAIKKILSASGYSVLTATNGLEALEVCDLHHDEIALVLTDVVMPHMSGRALGQQLADQHPHLKVMYMTGYTDAAISPYDIFAPGTKVISKPFTATDLTRRVRETLDDV